MFVLLKVQSLQLSFRPAGVSLGGGGGAKAPFGPPGYAPGIRIDLHKFSILYVTHFSPVPRFAACFAACFTWWTIFRSQPHTYSFVRTLSSETFTVVLFMNVA